MDAELALMQSAAEKFKHIEALKGDLSLKVAMRVTFLIRFVMIAFGVMVSSFLVMMFILSTKINLLTDTVTTMNANFVIMSQDMVSMKGNIQKMDSYVNAMPICSMM